MLMMGVRVHTARSRPGYNPRACTLGGARLCPSSLHPDKPQEFIVLEEKEHQAKKKKVTKLCKRPERAMSTWLGWDGEVSEGAGGTAAQNPWLSVTGHRLVRASWTKPASSCEELV